jgi:hypothetical protein
VVSETPTLTTSHENQPMGCHYGSRHHYVRPCVNSLPRKEEKFEQQFEQQLE